MGFAILLDKATLMGVPSLHYALGKGGSSKTDEFLEKFQTAFAPPPSFSENHVALFFRNT